MRLILSFALIFLPFYTNAQRVSAFEKYGSISVNDLNKKVYGLDSGANAIVLSDIGSVNIEGNVDGWFSLVTKKHTVIHILKKPAYDLANVEIRIYKDGIDEEKIKSLNGTTYNIENGKMIATNLEKSGQFKEKIDINRQVVKFTLPKVREGSIIEYEYEVVSPYITVPDPWYFQKLNAPVLWSEYKFATPIFFGYHFLNRGYQPFYLTDSTKKVENFNSLITPDEKAANERIDFSAPVTYYRWVMTNVPELKLENFTSSLMNHIARMDVQLAAQGKPLTLRTYRTSWPELINGLLKNEFAAKKSSVSIPDEVKNSVANLSSLEKVKEVYNYVRDNFKNNGKKDIYEIRKLDAVFASKQGSNAEINLVLTALLRDLKVEVNPVLLSTTENGTVPALSPMLSSMNYVIVQFVDKGKVFYLDASIPQLPFAQLPANCYNGHARLVNKLATPIFLFPDQTKETKFTSFLFVKDKAHLLKGAVTKTAGQFESLKIREEIIKEGKDEYFKKVQSGFKNMKISDGTIEHLTEYDEPVIVKYNLESTANNEELIYLTPAFDEALAKNPFSGDSRLYPIEMPYLQDQMTTATIEVPDGYKIDEFPKSFKINLDAAGETNFEYLISESENVISFRSTLKINRTNFSPLEYPVLRDFFAQIVKKQNEPIVFIKKK